MKILAFNTCNGALSVALLENEKVLQSLNLQENGKQAELLVCKLEEVLKAEKIWYNDLQLIASSQGPGSFTGVRIGLSCAKALKLATNLPLILVDSLEIIARKHCAYNGKILAAIDAKMDEFFVAEFLSQQNKLQRLSKSRLVSKEEFAKICELHNFICGTATNENDTPDAVFTGLIAYEEFTKNNAANALDANYLRLPKIGKRKETN